MSSPTPKSFCPLNRGRTCSEDCAWFDKFSGQCVIIVIAKVLYRGLGNKT